MPENCRYTKSKREILEISARSFLHRGYYICPATSMSGLSFSHTGGGLLEAWL